MSPYDYFAIVFYFGFVASVGLVFKKLNRNSVDYFAGGFRCTWWLLGASVFASNVSAWAFTGAAHIAYTYGVVIFVVTITDIMGYVLGFSWFAPRLRQVRAVTAMRAVRKRFSVATEQVYSWLMIVGSLVTATVWMVAVSVIISSVFDVPQSATIFATGASVTIMSLYGGRWAVIASDFIQLGLLMSVSVSVFLLAVYQLGGFGEYFDAIPDRLLNPILPHDTSYDMIWIAGFVLSSLVSRNNLTTAHRYISAKDSKHARLSTIVPIIGYLSLPICWFTVPMVAGSFSPNIEQEFSSLDIPAEGSYIAVAIQVLPNGLLGLLVAAIIASTMSSMDSALNRNAGYFVKSVYEPRIRKGQASQAELLTAGKAVTVVLSIVVVGLSVLIAERGRISLFDMYQQLNGRLTVPLAIPVFWGIFTSRSPKWAPLATLGFGLLVSFLIFDGIGTETGRRILNVFFSESSVDYIVNHPVTWSFLVNIPLSSLFFFSVGWLFPIRDEDYEKQVRQFFEDSRREVDFEREVGDDNTVFQAKTIGVMALVYGAFVSLLLLIPNPVEGRVAIGGIAAVMLSLGTGLYIYSKKRRPT